MAQAARKKKARTSRTRRGKSSASWGMLFIGLMSGSVLAALFFGALEDNEYGLGSGLKAWFVQQTKTVSPEIVQATTRVKELPKPKLDFYTVLPKVERVIVDPVPERKQDEHEPENVSYVLQLASYASFDDADRLKAQLTLNGYDAQVQKVTIEDKVYYRVRLGPYQSRRKLKNVKQDIDELGIKGGMLLRVTDP